MRAAPPLRRRSGQNFFIKKIIEIRSRKTIQLKTRTKKLFLFNTFMKSKINIDDYFNNKLRSKE